MEQLQIREVVNIYFALKNNHNVILPQFYSPNIGAEGELSNATALVIIPDHHLVRRILHVGATTYKSKDVATEQHFDNPKPTTLEIPSECFLKRVAIEDPEAIAGTGSKATKVLIPGNRQQPDLLVVTAACFRLACRCRQRPGMRGLKCAKFA
uniref:Uncharacterized protein n=1 Tax=Arundo donax TaxID=35708 RepID=A0A0A9DTC2_ARUDO